MLFTLKVYTIEPPKTYSGFKKPNMRSISDFSWIDIRAWRQYTNSASPQLQEIKE